MVNSIFFVFTIQYFYLCIYKCTVVYIEGIFENSYIYTYYIHNYDIENYDIELKKYLKTNIIWLLDMSF